jgi:Na+/pantothenate symporter
MKEDDKDMKIISEAKDELDILEVLVKRYGEKEINLLAVALLNAGKITLSKFFEGD